MILTATGVTVRYPESDRAALDGVSLSLNAGTLTAVVGPNGGGKTTLIRALLGLVPLDAGEVRVRGRPVRQWDRQALAREIGVVSQREETAFPLRAEEAVLFGRYAQLGPVRPVRDIDRVAVAAAMERCDVSALRTRFVETLSAGEWQRVRVARALAQEPRALVLDEPTSNLDIRHEMEVFELIRVLVDEGLGCLLVTHHLNLAARYADRMVLLDRGHVAAAGPPGVVLRTEVIQEVFHWRVAVTEWRPGVPQMIPLRPGEVQEQG